MRKTIWKRVISVFLSLALCFTMMPVTTMADEYYYLSLDVDYQYDYGEYYYAFTNHSFDGKIYFDQYTSCSLKMYIDSKDVSGYIGEPSQDYDYTSFSIPADIIADLYKQGEQHKLKYGLYDGSTEIYSEERNLTITRPSITVGSRNLENFKKSFVVGETYNVSDNISFYKYYRDWEYPGNESSLSDPQISNVEVINDISTPYAFSVRFESGNYILSADSIGKAKLNIYYDVDEGYYDENNGFISIDVESDEELVFFDTNYYSGNVYPGNQFEMKAQLKSTVNGEYGKVTDNCERPVKSYKWSVQSDLSNLITLTPNEQNPGTCTVKLSKDIQADRFYPINISAVYVNCRGEDTTISDTCMLYVTNESYEISCDVPKYMDLNETVTIHPVYVRTDSNGATELKYEDIRVSSDDSNIISVTDNGDGTYNLTRVGEGYCSINVNILYDTNWSSRSYSIWNDSSWMSFVNGSKTFDGQNDLTVCLNVSHMFIKDYSVTLYKGDVDDSNKIDRKYYTERNLDDIIYFTFSADWLKSLGNFSYFDLNAVAYKDGNEIDRAYTLINEYKADVDSIGITRSVLLNHPYTINELGTSSYYDSAEACSKSLVYQIDSVDVDDSNIIKLSKKDNGWEYTGIAVGKTNVNFKYHYYKERKKIEKTYSAEVEVYKCNYGINISCDNKPYYYIYPGATYYFDISTQTTEYKDGDYVYNVAPDLNYKFELQKFPEDIDVTVEQVANNKLKVTVDNNSTNGFFNINISGYDNKGNLIASTSTHNTIKTDDLYEASYNTISETDNSITVKPYLMLYNMDHPHGIDVSAQYDLSIEYYNGGIVTHKQNTDGTYTFTQNKDEDDEAIIKWWQKNQVNIGEYVASDYIMFSSSQDYDSSTETPVVTKSENLSILEGNKLNINIYYDVKYSHANVVRCSFENESGSEFYEAVNGYYDSTLGKYVNKVTININSGEITRPIKIELLDYDGNVIDEFTTSVESYIKKILSSTDSSYSKYKPLLKSLLNYGATSQKYFGIKTSELANRSLSSTDKVVNAVPQVVINRNNLIKTLQFDGITYCGSSLTVKNDIVLRHYFKIDEERDISNYEFLMLSDRDESTSTYSFLTPMKKDDMYYVEMLGKRTAFFSNMELEITTKGDSRYLKYSPLNYISRVYNSDSIDTKLKDLVDAMYWFEYQKGELGYPNIY